MSSLYISLKSFKNDAQTKNKGLLKTPSEQQKDRDNPEEITMHPIRIHKAGQNDAGSNL